MRLMCHQIGNVNKEALKRTNRNSGAESTVSEIKIHLMSLRANVSWLKKGSANLKIGKMR